MDCLLKLLFHWHLGNSFVFKFIRTLNFIYHMKFTSRIILAVIILNLISKSNQSG
jgi:hypothetical protein